MSEARRGEPGSGRKRPGGDGGELRRQVAAEAEAQWDAVNPPPDQPWGGTPPGTSVEPRARHVTQHGTLAEGDSLDVLEDEDAVLASLFVDWEAAWPLSAGRSATNAEMPQAEWDLGTAGKLTLEHVAVRLAAAEDVARVLRSQGPGALPAANELERANRSTRPLIDKLDELARGTAPVALAEDPQLARVVEQLRSVLEPELATSVPRAAQVRTLLGEARGQLQSAQYIRKHAPTHPGPGRWYDRFRLATRLRTAYDRLRGVPWPENPRLGNPAKTAPYGREGPEPRPRGGERGRPEPPPGS